LTHHVVAHEPPLFNVLRDDPQYAAELTEVLAAMRHAAECIESGRPEEGAAYFADHIGFGPGVWDGVFSAEQRATMVANADTWLDQSRDPRRLALSLDDLATTDVQVLITRGDRSPVLYAPALDRLLATAPGLASLTIGGCGHAVAHTHPVELAAAINDFVAS
jgi:pimeloyl-ACP methyl ester carboxylesterase